jgi:hypothetical protein
MKQWIVVCVVGIFVVVCSACGTTRPKYRDSLPPSDLVITYIENHSKNKTEAYVVVNRWVAVTYKSAQDVIQMNDKEAGIMIVKAVYPFHFSWYEPLIIFPIEHTGYVNYTVLLQVKDKKIKMEFTTGTITWTHPLRDSTRYYPEANMPELKKYYQNLRDALLRELNKEPETF